MYQILDIFLTANKAVQFSDLKLVSQPSQPIDGHPSFELQNQGTKVNLNWDGINAQDKAVIEKFLGLVYAAVTMYPSLSLVDQYSKKDEGSSPTKMPWLLQSLWQQKRMTLVNYIRHD